MGALLMTYRLQAMTVFVVAYAALWSFEPAYLSRLKQRWSPIRRDVEDGIL